ncbi:MAG: cyclophilin-like fold protein [Syntrophorhabdaceae bacterium]|nr:cyclophilin-like fold protein [Syntrophorhabdaceae bacterium]
MPTEIEITIKDITVKAELFDTECAKAITNALPVEAIPNEWGDEFYFTIPVEFTLDETATEDVNIGDIGYWPPGCALAIFFGPTPLSRGIKPVPASKVNIVGRIKDDPKMLKNAKGADKVKIYKAD